MASTSQCPFCGAVVRSDEHRCPQCGGENKNYIVDGQRRIFHPKTIEELKQYCAERGMPLFRMRFFIGEDYREPRAFGIYKAGEKRYIVYKNKDTGERAVRYDGPDEAFAVNELFEKLLSECHNRGIYPDGPIQRVSGSSRPAPSGKRENKGSNKAFIILLLIIGLLYLIGSLPEKIQKHREQAEVRAFHNNPGTYDSVKIGSDYYTYDLDSGKVVAAARPQYSLNNGYFREDLFLVPDEKQYYKAVDNPDEETTVQEKGIYYRDDYTWYVYILDEQDWRPAQKPDYRGAEIYLGSEWNSEWNIPDYHKSPVGGGYYKGGSDYYFRDDNNNEHTWYVYLKNTDDWGVSSCPLKLGVPETALKRLNHWNEREEELGEIRRFDQSTPYALETKAEGYYLQGNTIYYCIHGSRYYAFGKQPDLTAADVQETGNSIWYRCQTDPGTESLRYLGKKYRQEWHEEWSVTAFNQSAAGMEACSNSGYIRLGKDIFYYDGRRWYFCNSDSGTWKLSDSSPADNHKAEEYLGKDFREEWQEEWSVTDFEKSAIQVQRENKDGYVKQGKDLYYHYKNKWYSYSSDNDTWDLSESPADDDQADVYLGTVYQDADEKEWEEDWNTTDFKQSGTWQEIRNAEIRAEEAAREAERREAERKREEERRREDRWSSSDYDSWDSDDTDWGSDW